MPLLRCLSLPNVHFNPSHEHESFLALLALTLTPVLAAEPPVLKLDYKEDIEDSNEEIPRQIQQKFAKLMETDAELAKEFEKFEAPTGSGKYSPYPEVFPVILSREVYGHFEDLEGSKSFEMEVALFYRFEDGHSRGRATTSGFFARFSVEADITYKITKGVDSDFKISDTKFVAKFKGFSRTLTMPRSVYSSFDDE